MTGMADVLAEHNRRSGIRGMSICCDCGWSESIIGMRSSKGAFSDHQAAALSAAGFGDLREAQTQAWDEGFKQGGPMHDEHYGEPDKHTINPCRSAK